MILIEPHDSINRDYDTYRYSIFDVNINSIAVLLMSICILFCSITIDSINVNINAWSVPSKSQCPSAIGYHYHIR